MKKNIYKAGIIFFSAAVLFFIIYSATRMNAVKTYTWKLQSQAPENNPDYEALKIFADNVDKMSAGRLKIKIFPAGSITKGSEMFDGVAKRTTEMAQGWPNWWLAKDIGWNALQSGPFEFMTIESSMMYFYEDEGIRLANDLANPHGVLWRPAWWSGMEFGLLTAFPAASLSDLKGKKIRMGPGLPQETLMEAAGSLSIPIVPEEINNALKNGVIDGVEWTVPSATWNMGFHKVCTHIIVPAVWQPAVLGDFLINKKAYDELTDDIKLILETAIKEYALRATFYGKRLDIKALEDYRKSGLIINKWSENDMILWKNASDKIYNKYLNNSPSFKKIYDSKMRFKKQYNEYMKTHGSYE